MTYDGTNLRGYLDGSLVAGPAAESGSGGTCGEPNYTSVGAIHSGGYMQFMDGEVDESSVWSRALSASEISQLYNSGYGVQYPFASTTSATSFIPAFAYLGTSTASTTGIFGDVNGDGLSDFEQWLPGSTGQASYLGIGAGWAPANQFLPPKDFSVPSPNASMLVDLNGDGLDDWLYSDGASLYALLNTGAGWETNPEQQWTIGTSTLYQSPGTNTYYDHGVRFLDINGDSLPDFVRAYCGPTSWATSTVPTPEKGCTTVVLLNTGNGWATSTAYTMSPITTAQLSSGNWAGDFQYNEYANFIGNGQMMQDVISTVTNSKGGRTSVAYTPSTKIGGNQELPYEVLLATAIGTYDGLGNAATTTYTYSGGQQYLAQGVRDRKFAGFASSTATLPDSIVKTYFDQGISTIKALGEQADGYAQINHPFRKDIFDLSGNLIQSNFYRWDSIDRGNSSSFVNLGRQVEQDYALDGTHRDKATDYTYSTTTDDLIAQTDYGEVTGNSDGTFTDTGSDKRTTSFTYAASSSVNLSVLSEKKVLNSGSAPSPTRSSITTIFHSAKSLSATTRARKIGSAAPTTRARPRPTTPTASSPPPPIAAAMPPATNTMRSTCTSRRRPIRSIRRRSTFTITQTANPN